MQMSLFWINNKTRWVTRDREWQMPKEKPAKNGKEHYISIKFESRPKKADFSDKETISADSADDTKIVCLYAVVLPNSQRVT